MNCIARSFPSPPLRRSDLQPKRRRQQNLSSQSPSLGSFEQILYISPQRQRFASLNASAIQSSLVLAATSPAKSGDVSVLIQTGAVLIIAYFIANFIVPELIMKSYQSDEDEQRKKSAEKARLEEDEETDRSEGSGQARSSMAKKQGFGSNKR